MKNFVEKYADIPVLEPVMTRVSAPSKVSWGLHSTRYVQQQPTWSPGVAGRCPGPRASLRARQRHGLTSDLLLTSPGTQPELGATDFRAGEVFRNFPRIEELYENCAKTEGKKKDLDCATMLRMNSPGLR